MAGDYTSQVLLNGLRAFFDESDPRLLGNRPPAPDPSPVLALAEVQKLKKVVPDRLPGLCTGCPERPVFAAMKLVEQDLGLHHVSADIGCHLFSILPPFNIGATTMGFGLGPASSAAFNVKGAKRSISVMGDGGFWHNGLTSGIGNAVFNKHDGVFLIIDNFYSAATGGQDIMSSRAINPARATNNTIVDAVKGVGVKWVRHIDRTYDVTRMRDTLREALTTKEGGPKVIVASSECMLNKQRREKPLFQKSVRGGERMVKRALWRRRGRVHRRSRLHPSVRLPVAFREATLDDPLQATIRSRPSTITASAAAIAAKWRMQPFSARPSSAPMSCTIQAPSTNGASA